MISVSVLVANPEVVIASDGLTNLVTSSSSALIQFGSLSNLLPVQEGQAFPKIISSTPAPLEVEQLGNVSAEINSTQSDQQKEAGCLISNHYPEAVMQWCELIQRHAQENGLDPNLVAAIILQESNGNPQAYSPSGAVGLMQVMPRDGIAAGFGCSSGPCFAGRPSMNELFDPEFNIAYGTHMFAGLVQKHGNVRDALRAYGPAGWGYGYADKVLAIYNQYR